MKRWNKIDQLFRKVFSDLKLNQYKYFISNVVLCTNIVDGKTVTPPEEAVEKCKGNWQALIEKTKPKIILVLGSTAMKAFELNENNEGITKLRGNFFDYNNIPLVLTYHPSYVMRQPNGLQSEEGKQFISDIRKVENYLVGLEKQGVISKILEVSLEKELQTNLTNSSCVSQNKVKLTNCYSIELPSEFYDDKLMLFDCQYVYNDNSVLYIFKDSDENKKYYKTTAEKYYYVNTRQTFLGNSEFILPVENVDLIVVKGVGDKSQKFASYEEDVSPELRCTIDYKFKRQNVEPLYNLKKMFVDIEVFSSGELEFPDPKKAEKPISCITYKVTNKKTVVCLNRLTGIDEKSKNLSEREFDDYILKIFDSERDLLLHFARVVSEENPDVLTGWNFINFDLLTIIGRMQKNSINVNLLSPLGIVYYNIGKSFKIFIYGIHVLDMLELYKFFTYSREESYALDFIAKKYLGVGKVSFSGSIDKIYSENIELFLDYAKMDVVLLEKLDDALDFINQRYTIVKICGTTWRSSESTIGLVDPLCLTFAKQNNLVCRSVCYASNGEYIPGGYVRTPKGGRYSYLVDFDFSSLYPSIIRTFNIGPDTYIAKIDPKNAYEIIYKKDKIDLNEMLTVSMLPMYEDRRVNKTITYGDFLKKLEEKGYIVTISGCVFKGHQETESFLSNIIRRIMLERTKYKSLMKESKKEGNSDLVKKYDSFQLAYKTLANSLYGVLAFPAFRFFCSDLASTITLTGQEITKFTGYHLNKYLKNGSFDVDNDFIFDYDNKNLEYVLYQDTDSIFLRLDEFK